VPAQELGGDVVTLLPEVPHVPWSLELTDECVRRATKAFDSAARLCRELVSLYSVRRGSWLLRIQRIAWHPLQTVYTILRFRVWGLWPDAEGSAPNRSCTSITTTAQDGLWRRPITACAPSLSADTATSGFVPGPTVSTPR
jgi:hypothetical protein